MGDSWRDPDGAVAVVAAVVLAVGLLGLAGPTLVARRQRAVAATVLLAGFAAAAHAAGSPAPVWATPLAVAVACGMTLPLSPAVVRRAADWVGRPAVAWAGLLGTGLLLAGWSAAGRRPTADPATPPDRTDSADP